MKRLERYKTDAEKRKRVQRKKQRADEQELRLVITVSLITNEAHTLYLMSTFEILPCLPFLVKKFLHALAD